MHHTTNPFQTSMETMSYNEAQEERRRLHYVYDNMLQSDLQKEKGVMTQCIESVKKVTFKS